MNGSNSANETVTEKILTLARRGMGRRSISKEFGVSEWRVRKILEENPGRTPVSLTEKMRSQIDLAEYKKLKKQKTFFTDFHFNNITLKHA